MTDLPTPVHSLEIIDQSTLRQHIFRLVWPATIESVLQMLVGIIASAMVGRISADAIAAVGLSNRVSQMVWAIFSAISTGATVLVAQSAGARNFHAARKTGVESLQLALVSSVAFAAVIYMYASPILSFFRSTPELLLIARGYLRVISAGLPFMVIMLVAGGIMRGAGNTKTPMQIAVIVNILNVIGQFLLIFGNLGFPALGLTGSALATVIAQFIGALLALYMVFSPVSGISLVRPTKLRWDLAEIRRILSIGIPTAFEFVFWQIAAVILTRLIAESGTIALAAYTQGLTAESLSYLPASGFGIAATALVGQSLGRRDLSLAGRYVRETALWAFILGLFTGACLLFLPKQLMALLSNDKGVISLGAIYLQLMAVAQPTFNIAGVLSGALRGAGDTKVPMYVAGTGLYLVRLPLAFFLSRQMGFGVVGIWSAMTVDMFFRFFLTWFRYRQGKWRRRFAS